MKDDEEEADHSLNTHGGDNVLGRSVKSHKMRDVNNNNGISSEAFQKGMWLERDKVKLELEGMHGKEREKLQRKIDNLNYKLGDIEASYEAEVKRSKEIIQQLQLERNQYSQEELNAAIEAAKKFDYQLADELYANVIANNELAVESTARAEHGRGEIALSEIRYDHALVHFQRAVDLSSTFERLKDHAIMLKNMGFLKLALKQQLKAGKIALSSYGKLSAEYSTHLNNLGGILLLQGQLIRAEILLRKAIQIDKAIYCEESHELAKHLNNLGIVYRNQNKDTEAEECYRQAIEIDIQTVGKEHSSYGKHVGNLASLLRSKKKYVEAESCFKEALEVCKITVTEKHPDFAIRLNNLAVLWEDIDKPHEAKQGYERALRILQETFRRDHRDVVMVRDNLDNLNKKLS